MQSSAEECQWISGQLFGAAGGAPGLGSGILARDRHSRQRKAGARKGERLYILSFFCSLPGASVAFCQHLHVQKFSIRFSSTIIRQLLLVLIAYNLMVMRCYTASLVITVRVQMRNPCVLKSVTPALLSKEAAKIND